MKNWRLLFLMLAVTLALGGCGLVAREPELSPQEVVTKFYRWHIGYPGNPLVDRAYRDSPYLSDSFVQDVDEVVEGGFRADPILLAQDIPDRFTVEGAETMDGEAVVTVYFYFGENGAPVERTVDLELMDGAWKITDVSMEP
jgi:hypothetical protein